MVWRECKEVLFSITNIITERERERGREGEGERGRERQRQTQRGKIRQIRVRVYRGSPVTLRSLDVPRYGDPNNLEVGIVFSGPTQTGYC